MPLAVHAMKPHRRQVGVLALLFCRIVRRKEASKDHYGVQRDEQDKPSRDCVPRSHALLSARIRGSAQYKNRSARKFPPTKKRVKNKTQPINTQISRANMTSSKNGSTPGQLITTSTAIDPLHRVSK